METKSPSPATHLPQAFLKRMNQILGAEAGDFFDHYAQPADTALRFNTLKGDPQELEAGLPFDLTPLPWSPAGRLVRDAGEQPGLHTHHSAGLYYIQDAAAQAVSEILDPQPGERILDIAAAPGGKTTDIAARMQNQGLLVANEIHTKRVWDLVRNLERWGARNTVVANETPERLATALPGFFDRVLVDAPCSGEGMFRKMPETVSDWSPEFIVECVLRQDAILAAAAVTVRPGGWLCYATCTFAPEEDELVIARFLADHPDFKLATPPWKPGYARGLAPFGQAGADTPVRLWPHRAPGEGHFIALLTRAGSARPAPVRAPQPSATLTRLRPLWERFSGESLSPGFELPGVLVLAKSQLYAAPADLAGLGGLNLVRPGLWLGSFKKDRFEPAHPFAMALRPAEAVRRADLDQAALAAYLRREAVPSPGADGWTLVTMEGRYPLGWGKRVRGLLKNHYPKQLRR